MPTFEWLSHVSAQVDAQVVGDVVTRLEVEQGRCDPARLLDEARSAESPLHRLFEWDDTVAAERYRLRQARRIIASVRVRSPETGEAKPAFVRVHHVAEQGVSDGYVEMQRALSDASARRGIAADVERRLLGLRSRYTDLNEFDEVWEAIDLYIAARKSKPVAEGGEGRPGSDMSAVLSRLTDN